MSAVWLNSSYKHRLKSGRPLPVPNSSGGSLAEVKGRLKQISTLIGKKPSYDLPKSQFGLWNQFPGDRADSGGARRGRW